MAEANKTLQGRVRLSVSVPVVGAFLFCMAIRPFLRRISDSLYGSFDCNNIIPKLSGVASKFDPVDLCSANNYLRVALLVLVIAYSMAIIFVSVYNFRNLTFEVLKAPVKELALLLSFLLVPGAVGMYLFIWGDLNLRIYGSSPENYALAMDYASSQINILMYAVNLLLFVPVAVLFALFIKR